MNVQEETLTLDSFAYGGECFGRSLEGRATFVPFALPGEKVRVRLFEEKRGFARGELLEILESSPELATAGDRSRSCFSSNGWENTLENVLPPVTCFRIYPFIFSFPLISFPIA